MNRVVRPPPESAPLLPRVPGWAVPRGPVTNDAEAAFLAGAALTSLDNLVRSDPRWSGAWRQRLALRGAAAAVALSGRAEDEAALRDAWLLRPTGGDPGPAGSILAAWRRLADRSAGVDEESLRSMVALLGLRWSDTLAVLPARVADLAGSGRPAPMAAAAIMADVHGLAPEAALLGWWLADQIVALRLRWPLPVPLLVTQARSPMFRTLGRRGRVQPEDEGFERAVCVALVHSTLDAVKLAGELAPRAARLAEVVPKLRAKGAGDVVELLLTDDAVPGTLTMAKLSRWGSRRLFERLEALKAVRELTGRSSFKLYGL